MHRPIAIGAAVSLFAILSLSVGSGLASAAELAPGAKAPEFSLPGSDGKLHTLAQHTGQRGVVLAWFPKAFTPG